MARNASTGRWRPSNGNNVAFVSRRDGADRRHSIGRTACHRRRDTLRRIDFLSRVPCLAAPRRRQPQRPADV